jgi:serine protease Do
MAWRQRSAFRSLSTSFLTVFCLVILGAGSWADTKPITVTDPNYLTEILKKPAPGSVEELRAIQTQVNKVVNKVQPATVGIISGGASGSGVIISKDGFVLTAGHVSGAKDRTVRLIFPDGTEKRGKTLGINKDIDSGLIKITDEGDYPFVEMGKSADLTQGQWVISMGHPGGFRKGRTPVVRLGRIQTTNSNLIQTDCTLVGGDSGGPLFDMEGRVIGIHSRIGVLITANIHVPVDTYRETWDRLAKSEVWGDRIGGGGRRQGPGNTAKPGYLGVMSHEGSDQADIAKIVPGSPAEKAGLQIGDVIIKFNDKDIHQFSDLVDQVGRKKAGDEVSVVVLRGNQQLTFKVKLTAKPDE